MENNREFDFYDEDFEEEIQNFVCDKLDYLSGTLEKYLEYKLMKLDKNTTVEDVKQDIHCYGCMLYLMSSQFRLMPIFTCPIAKLDELSTADSTKTIFISLIVKKYRVYLKKMIEEDEIMKVKDLLDRYCSTFWDILLFQLLDLTIKRKSSFFSCLQRRYSSRRREPIKEETKRKVRTMLTSKFRIQNRRRISSKENKNMVTWNRKLRSRKKMLFMTKSFMKSIQRWSVWARIHSSSLLSWARSLCLLCSWIWRSWLSSDKTDQPTI